MHLVFAICLSLFLPFLQAGFADHTNSGNYQIRNCDAGQTNSKASVLQALLPQIYNNLQAVIADAELGIASTHGFAAFFYRNKNIPYVQSIFKKIAAGSPLRLPPNEGHATNPLREIVLPFIVCIKPGVPETLGASAYCDERGGYAGNHENYIFLCPSFWEAEPEAESFQCPRVRKNTLTPNDDELTLNLQAMLIHELAHVYGVTPHSRWQGGGFEKYNIADVVNLDEDSALRNAANYAYYYAAIQADCTRWPKRALPHDNLRNLLEVSADSPLTDNPIIPAANATGPLDFVLPESATLPPTFNVSMGFCHDAVYAPNKSVCCNETTGGWVPRTILMDGDGLSPSCRGD